jgi:tetratricopeptide (TPR) repeat protein
MSTVVRPQQRELWVTVGDKRPASHSHFVGFQIDWDRMEIKPIGVKRVDLYDEIPNWEKSLSYYAQARISYEKERYDSTLLMLSEGIRMARMDGKIEYPYYYMRARVLRSLGQYEAAYKDFEFLWTHHSKLHPYQQALVAMYSVENGDHLSGKLTGEQRKSRLKHADNQLKYMDKLYDHFDLRNKFKVLGMLWGGLFAPDVDLPKLDFVTVE